MADLLAPAITLLMMGLFATGCVFYLQRVRHGRADYVAELERRQPDFD